MKPFYYYSPESNFISKKIDGIIQATIILSDCFNYGIDKSWADLLTEDVENWSTEKILAKSTIVFRNDPPSSQLIKKCIETYQQIKKVNSLKHKTKDILTAIGIFKKTIGILRKNLINHKFELFKHNAIIELQPFIDEDIWHLVLFDYEYKDNKEYVLISKILKTLTERDFIFCLDHSLDDLLGFSVYDSIENSLCDFIKIPLWDFPMLHGLNFAQLKYTRDNLQPALIPYNLKLKELSEEIFNMPFTIENQTQLKQICKDKLEHLIQPIQESIDNSLYIMQVKNKLGFKPHIKFCLGITSAETLINYYEKTETVLPYVADEIKIQTARHIDLKSSYVFCYFQPYIYDDLQEE